MAVAALAAGCYLLVQAWGWHYQVAANLSAGRSPDRNPPMLLWYGLPMFEAGVLAGVLPAAAARGWAHLLRVLTLCV